MRNYRKKLIKTAATVLTLSMFYVITFPIVLAQEPQKVNICDVLKRERSASEPTPPHIPGMLKEQEDLSLSGEEGKAVDEAASPVRDDIFPYIINKLNDSDDTLIYEVRKAVAELARYKGNLFYVREEVFYYDLAVYVILNMLISMHELFKTPDCADASYKGVTKPSVNFMHFVSIITYHLYCQDTDGEIDLSGLKSTLILSLIYIDRLIYEVKSLIVDSDNIFRIFSLAYMTASKFYDDNTVNNKFMAKVMGLTVENLNMMELRFLADLRFGLFVSEWEYNKYNLAFKRIITYIKYNSVFRIEAP